jgi:hypothetical protein
MKFIAWILIQIGLWLTPCNHHFMADKIYHPKGIKNYAYILREKCLDCGTIRYPISGRTWR